MPFPAYERSAYQGKPIQFYQFLRSSGGVDIYWRYNTSDRDLVFSGNTYSATAISDGGMRFSGEAASTELEITMPITEAFCVDFRLGGSVPSDTVYLTIRRCHADDITGIDDPAPMVSAAAVVWVGTVTGLTQINDIEARVRCAMLPASFQRSGLRQPWSRRCPHALYAAGTCKVNKATFVTVATLSAVDGVTASSPSFDVLADGWFSGGFIEYNLANGLLERRMVVKHAGPDLRLLGTPAGLVVGAVVSAYPGCSRTTTDCINKFNNLANFGGFPHIRGRSPFDGNPVF